MLQFFRKCWPSELISSALFSLSMRLQSIFGIWWSFCSQLFSFFNWMISFPFDTVYYSHQGTSKNHVIFIFTHCTGCLEWNWILMFLLFQLHGQTPTALSCFPQPSVANWQGLGGRLPSIAWKYFITCYNTLTPCQLVVISCRKLHGTTNRILAYMFNAGLKSKNNA